MADAIVQEWQEAIRAAASARRPLRLRGGGTKDFYGEASDGEVVDTTRYAGVVDYDPTELVVTARGGTRLADVEAMMADAGQMLAFEPPHFGAGATLGGCVAVGLSGPRRPYGGAVRDSMLGIRVLDGQGEDLSFGGRVMKNVAGFDVSRLMTGALGTLGLILEVSVKCAPRPKREATVTFECSGEEAIRRVCEWAREPWPISATCYDSGRLAVRFSGAPPAVEAAQRKLGGTALESSANYWRDVREHTHPFFGAALKAGSVWRLSVRASAPYRTWPGAQLIEWGGALRWVALAADADSAALRTWAREQGGHATLFRAKGERRGVFTPLDAATLAITRRLKAVFDPAGILNPGRLYAGV